MKLKNILIPLAILGTVVVVYFLTKKGTAPIVQNIPNPSGSGAYPGVPLQASPVQTYNVEPARLGPAPTLYQLPLQDPNTTSVATDGGGLQPYLVSNIPPGQDTQKVPAKIAASGDSCGCKSPCDSDFGKELVSSKQKQITDLAKNQPGIFDVMLANYKSQNIKDPAFEMFGMLLFDQQQTAPKHSDVTPPAGKITGRLN